LLALIGFGVFLFGRNLWAWYQFRSGRAALEKYHDVEARDHLRASLRVWPRDPETLLLAARAARRLGLFLEAEDLLKRYRQARGEDDDLTLEELLLQAERGDLDSIRDTLQTLLDQNDANAPLILEAQARGYLRQFRLHEAKARLKKWLRLQPDNPQAYFLQGKVETESLNSGLALASYRKALQLDPEHDEARRQLAGHLLEIAQAREALPHVNHLLRRRPDDPLLRVLLARCRSQLAQPDQAVAILDEVLARHPHLPEALAERGKLALDRGQPDKAEPLLREASQRDPTNFQVHHLLVRALRRNGKEKEARRLEKRTRQMEDDITRIQEIVTRQMQARPHDPALHYQVGMIALRAGSASQGLRWLHSALEEDPQYLPAHRALALYYQLAGSPGRAAYHPKFVDAAARKRPEVRCR
jgi:tetratricopeptide (TPR) repeat protein